jgi:hypothetical protein
MKTFRYELGHTYMETMTVSELIAKLQEFPADMPVVGTWEGVCVPFRGDRLTIKSGFNGGHKDDASDVLMIDVDNY